MSANLLERAATAGWLPATIDPLEAQPEGPVIKVPGIDSYEPRDGSTVCTLAQFARARGWPAYRAWQILRPLTRRHIVWHLRRGVYRIPNHIIAGATP